MTPRRSRGRRLVLAAAAAVVLVLAGCSEVKNNGQNSLRAQEPAGAEDRRPLRPDPDHRDRHRHRDHGRHGRARRSKFRYRPGKNENPKQVHGNTRLEIGWTILPALLLAIIAVPTVATIFDLAENPGPSALQVTVEGKQWWWEFSLPGGQGRHRERARHPDRPRRLPRPHRLQRHRRVEDLQRDPQLLGPRARRQEGRRPRPDQHPHDLRRQARHLPRAVRGVLRALARQHALPGHRQDPRRLRAVDPGAAAGPGEPALRVRRHHAAPARPRNCSSRRFQCTNCHVFDDSSTAAYGPNLTHLASRTTFASGEYPLNTREPHQLGEGRARR